MQFDPAAYRHHLDAFDISEDAKLACMQTVWTYLDGVLDRLCGGSPEQILLGIRGTANAALPPDPLDSDHALASTFNDAAGETMAGKRCP